MTFEREPAAPLTGHAADTPGAWYLRGYMDAAKHLPPTLPADRRARIAYLKGYRAGAGKHAPPLSDN